MSNIIKIRYYLDKIKELHRDNINDPSIVLIHLLQNYQQNKKNKHSISHNAGLLFSNKAPPMFANKISRELANLSLTDCLNKTNQTLTTYFLKNKHKKNSEFAALWVAFIYYYQPIISVEQHSFFRDACITAQLIKKNNLNTFVDDLFMNINSNNDYQNLIAECNKLINIIKALGLNWITPQNQKKLIKILPWIPFWRNENDEKDYESILIAMDTMRKLLTEQELIEFHTELLSSLTKDIASTDYQTLFIISKMPFCNLQNDTLVKKLMATLDHQYIDENEDDNQYRQCAIIEIILKITNDKAIHHQIYLKIADLLDSDDENYVEMLLTNIEIPDQFKKIYITKLLCNLIKTTRNRYDCIIALEKLIDNNIDRDNYLEILLDLIIKKPYFNAVSSLKKIPLTPYLSSRLFKVVLSLLRDDSSYIAVDIIRTQAFSRKQQIALLTLLRTLINIHNENIYLYIEAMRYLPTTKIDLKMITNILINAIETEHETPAINLLQKFDIPATQLQTACDKLMEKIQTTDYYTTCDIITTLISLENRYNIHTRIDKDVFFEKVISILTPHPKGNCYERVCLALLKIDIPKNYLRKIINIMLDNSVNTLIQFSNASLYFLLNTRTSSIAKQKIIDVMLTNLQKYLNQNYQSHTIIDLIDKIIGFIAKHFSPSQQIGITSKIETVLIGNEIIADHLINKIHSLIEVEVKLTEENILPGEMVKEVFRYI